MRRWTLVLLVVFLCSSPVIAVDLGKAEGAVVVDGTRIDLRYAYAIDHQKNELTNQRSDTRIVLTSDPLPDDAKLEEIDYAFPEGTLGIVVCLTRARKVSHVVVQHPKGMYDAGYFDNDRDYQFKPEENAERGTVAGNVSSRKVATHTMTFSFDVNFHAAIK